MIMCAMTAHAKNPAPGKSCKTTRVDFHDNNGWGNGDQNPPGNSGDHNNAENGPGNTPPPGNPGGNNGWGNGDQKAPGNSASNNNAENSQATPPPPAKNTPARRVK